MSPAGIAPRIAVVGSRGYPRLDDVATVLAAFPRSAVVVTGDAKGVDAKARAVATATGRDVAVHFADWKRLGLPAGPERNGRVVADCDALVGFWDGVSTGTPNAVAQAVAAGRVVAVVKQDLSAGFWPFVLRAVAAAKVRATARGWVAP